MTSLATCLVGEAGAVCNEVGGLGSHRLTVERSLDSNDIIQAISGARSVSGFHDLKKPARDWRNANGHTPFKNLFQVAGHPCGQDTLISCKAGAVSGEFATLKKGRFFRLSAQDVADSLGRPVTWIDLSGHLGLGIKLKTPPSGKAFRKEMDRKGILIDRVLQEMDSLDRDPWFGIFYRETCSYAFLYGVKYRVRADSVHHLSTQVYYRFRLPFLSPHILGGQSAVYIVDSAAVPNMPRIADLLERHRE